MQSATQKYDALNLSLLDKVELSTEQWEIIAHGRDEPLAPAYRNPLPIVVARFKRAAAEEIMLRAKRQTALQMDKKSRIVADYNRDMAAIDVALFGPGYGKQSCQLGPFSQPVTPKIHGDVGQEESERVYISRIGALPVQYIRMAEVESQPLVRQVEIMSLIKAADNFSTPESTVRAKAKLVDMGILKELAIGDVALMTLRFKGPPFVGGTLHCSSEIPKTQEGLAKVHSALFRSYFKSPSA